MLWDIRNWSSIEQCFLNFYWCLGQTPFASLSLFRLFYMVLVGWYEFSPSSLSPPPPLRSYFSLSLYIFRMFYTRCVWFLSFLCILSPTSISFFFPNCASEISWVILLLVFGMYFFSPFFSFIWVWGGCYQEPEWHFFVHFFSFVQPEIGLFLGPQVSPFSCKASFSSFSFPCPKSLIHYMRSTPPLLPPPPPQAIHSRTYS